MHIYHMPFSVFLSFSQIQSCFITMTVCVCVVWVCLCVCVGRCPVKSWRYACMSQNWKNIWTPGTRVGVKWLWAKSGKEFSSPPDFGTGKANINPCSMTSSSYSLSGLWVAWVVLWENEICLVQSVARSIRDSSLQVSERFHHFQNIIRYGLLESVIGLMKMGLNL